MAYRIDQNNNRTQSPLTAPETAAYKTWAASSFGASFVAGITDPAQLAAALNAERGASNPVPQGSVPVATIAKADVQKLMTGIIAPMLKLSAQPATLAYWQYVSDKVDAFVGESYTSDDAGPWLKEAIAEGLLTQAQAAAITSTPDESYVSGWQPGPLAPLVFGSWLVVETSDAAGLVAG